MSGDQCRSVIRCWINALGLVVFSLAFCSSSVAAPDKHSPVIFGGDPAYAPYEWVEGRQAKGFHIDVEAAMGAVSKTSVVHRSAAWHTIIEALKDGQVDVVPMLRTPERERLFWFSEPIYLTQHAIYTRADPGRVTDRQDLANWKVAVERSSFAYEQAKAGEISAKKLILTDTTPGALMAVVRGQADYAILASGPADYQIESLKLPLVRVASPLWPREYAFAVRADRRAISRWVKATFDRVSEDGTLERLSEHWHVKPLPASASKADVWKILAFALVMALGMGFLICRERTQVRHERSARATAEHTLALSERYDRATSLPNRKIYLEEIGRFLEEKADPLLDMIVVKVLDNGRISAGVTSTPDDTTLCRVSELISARAIIAGVVGAGSFAALLNVEDTGALVTELRKVLGDFEVGTSRKIAIGAARLQTETDPRRFLNKAEVALADALARGRSWVIYDPALEPDPVHIQLVRDFELFGREQIFAEFQPQLNLRSGVVDSAEVLVRWNHPERGLIPPGEFIPLLETAGLVQVVTSKMIEEATLLSARMRQLELQCRLSINLSVSDLDEQDVGTALSGSARANGADLNNLMVELTETSAIANPVKISRELQSLAQMGVKTAIDDFGTGFSSLAHLTNLPIDELKIDQSFISKMLFSPRHRKVVVSIVEMARRLSLEVVAEGAEDLNTVRALAQLGCNRVQGYAVSKPLSANDLIALLQQHASSDGASAMMAL